MKKRGEVDPAKEGWHPVHPQGDGGKSGNPLTITKRNGAIVPFNRERIYRALEAAFRETRRIEAQTSTRPDIEVDIEEITAQVVGKGVDLAKKGVSLTVEGIQDIVEITLMENSFHDVARDYIIYRDQHKALRADDPRHLKLRRKGRHSLVRFNPIKISTSLEKTFRRVRHLENGTPKKLVDTVNALTQKVVDRGMELAQTTRELHVDELQDSIEEILMREGHFREAKEYILHRSAKGEPSPSELPPVAKTRRVDAQSRRSFSILTDRGEKREVEESELLAKLEWACRGFEGVARAEEILEGALLNFYEEMREEEIDQALIMTARAHIERDPAYAAIASRLLLGKIYRETMGIEPIDPHLEERHRRHFQRQIALGIQSGRLHPDLAAFDLDALGEEMLLKRDDAFRYIGLQTLYDRYLLQEGKRRLETPQIFWMRIAMGIALKEREKSPRAIEFYHALSQFHYLPSTPTLFNSGTTHPQLSACYISTVEDDLQSIFKTISDDAQLSKWAGGIGNDWTSVRGMGAHIKGTNGESQGIIPFLKIANDTAVAVNQGGKRKGAICAYLEPWHIDIEDFLELRKNTGDDRRRTHDMHTANWIPDLFVKRVKDNGKWTLFSPDSVPDLHDLYGEAFAKRYVEYEQMAREGKIPFKTIDAMALWRKMLGMIFETGHPWITFKDPSNIRSPQDHVGVVHGSNLCTEILLNTSQEETAVCNIGSINLVPHMTERGIDEKKLAGTIATAMRMLDNVIDVNFYPIPEAKRASCTHRAIGLGLMGFQDALYALGISYASHEAVDFADRSMEMIAYHSILASSELARERGTYSSYRGSKWDRNTLPIDTIALLEKERGEKVDMDRTTTLDWERVRRSIRAHGMRNSNTLAIAPTATISNIAGVSASIEPYYKHLYAKSNLSGEFTICNPYLVDALKSQGLWDDQMIDDLKYFDGSIAEIDRIPEEIKRRFPTAFEIPPEWIIDCGSRRQKWIDQGQSLNLYLAEARGKTLHNMYLLAWSKGLKTTYYLRSLGATQIEKSTMDINKRQLQPRWMKHTSPSSRIKIERDESGCDPDEGCEICQ